MSSVTSDILVSLSAIAVEYFIFLGSECSEKWHLALSCNTYQYALVVQYVYFVVVVGCFNA